MEPGPASLDEVTGGREVIHETHFYGWTKETEAKDKLEEPLKLVWGRGGSRSWKRKKNRNNHGN